MDQLTSLWDGRTDGLRVTDEKNREMKTEGSRMVGWGEDAPDGF